MLIFKKRRRKNSRRLNGHRQVRVMRMACRSVEGFRDEVGFKPETWYLAEGYMVSLLLSVSRHVCREPFHLRSH